MPLHAFHPPAKAFSLLLATLILASLATGCGAGAGTPASVAPDPGPEPIVITELDLDELLSQGLPLILNFGDDSEPSRETQGNLESLYADHYAEILIRSVDLSANPQAKEGFPAPELPTQFFYNADGAPIPLPMQYGSFMSSYISVDTQETIFTAHEGPLDEDGIRIVKEIMGLK